MKFYHFSSFFFLMMKRFCCYIKKTSNGEGVFLWMEFSNFLFFPAGHYATGEKIFGFSNSYFFPLKRQTFVKFVVFCVAHFLFWKREMVGKKMVEWIGGTIKGFLGFGLIFELILLTFFFLKFHFLWHNIYMKQEVFFFKTCLGRKRKT